MSDDTQKNAATKMHKTIEALKIELTKLRTGRAHSSLLDHVKISYYGSEMPINQVANVSASDARTLTITPWDKNMVESIEKAILNSDLGLNPVTAGTVIRVPLPPLTEERRRELVKVVRSEGEEARVAIRNIRRDANNHFKDLAKQKQMSEDDARHNEDIIQKLTDKHIAEVDAILVTKENELMDV